MSAMDDHEELAGVQLAACNLLLPLSSEKQVQDAIRSAGGGDRVRRAMAAASADPLLTATVGPALLLRILDGASQSTVGQEREAVAARGEGRPAPAERKATAVQDKHAKLCLDPAGLVRKGKFGGIRLFDSLLSDAIGFMASSVGRAMYAEHVMAAGSQVAFSPPNHPNYTTTPEQEWYFVVGVDGIDQKTFELKPDGRPTCREGSMLPGRNAKRVADLMEMPQAQRAGLTGFEIVALRLYSGAMYARYNTILRDTLPEEEDAQSNSGRADADANLFPTTIHAIVSGIRKLAAVAKMPEGGAVFRGLSGLALPPEFFEEDEQGFAGGVEASLMSTTTNEEVARRYSGAREGRLATIFKLTLGKSSLGADISWLSQFEGEAEMVFPPRTQLQIVEQEEGSDGVSVITLKPTTFQKVSTVEEAMSSRKEGMKHWARSVAWDLRNEAVRDGKMDSLLAQRLDALEGKLVADHSAQAPEWYNDNLKYKTCVPQLLKDADIARAQIYDSNSVLCKSLAAQRGQQGPPGAEGEASACGAAPVTGGRGGGELAGSSNEVTALHSKFSQDPSFRGIKATFASDSLFQVGIDGIIGPMDEQYERAMFNEHNTVADARSNFRAWNAGHVLDTNAEQEWLAVVGSRGVVREGDRFRFDPSQSEPEVAEGMMVRGRNRKRLADLLETSAATKASLTPAEVVALRLYSGPMYIKYNGVLRRKGKAEASAGTSFSATIHVICSALQKLSRVTTPPPGLIVYRGTGGMALDADFLEQDEQGGAGGVECGLMSTTPDKEVALGYAGVATGKDLPTLFEIEVGKTSIGADISMFSQFEDEKEFLYAPLLKMEIIGTPRVERYEGRELSVLRMALTVNQRAKTVEQAARSRRDFLEQLASSREWDFLHWAKSKGLVNRLLPRIRKLAGVLRGVVADRKSVV